MRVRSKEPAPALTSRSWTAVPLCRRRCLTSRRPPCTFRPALQAACTPSMCSTLACDLPLAASTRKSRCAHFQSNRMASGARCGGWPCWKPWSLQQLVLPVYSHGNCLATCQTEFGRATLPAPLQVWALAPLLDARKEQAGPLLLATLTDHNSTVNTVRFSKDGRYLASGGCRARGRTGQGEILPRSGRQSGAGCCIRAAMQRTWCSAGTAPTRGARLDFTCSLPLPTLPSLPHTRRRRPHDLHL